MTLSTITQQSPICQDPTETKSDFSPSHQRTIPPQATAHHNSLSPNLITVYYKRGTGIEKRYGVPHYHRLLTMGMFHKKHDDIRHLLIDLGLETKERDAIFALLRLFIYYGRTYPKAADLAEDTGISKRTFWRAVGKLRSYGVIEVINRYCKHRQISNAYRLDKLVVIIARYLAEHGQAFKKFGSQLVTFLSSFWSDIWNADINLSLTAPIKLVLAGGGGVSRNGSRFCCNRLAVIYNAGSHRSEEMP